MDKYVTYIRVSTKKQGSTQLGLDAQRKMCSDYIERKNGELIKEFQDVESGSHRNRPGLWAAIDYCKANGFALVIARLDRLARDVEFTFSIIRTGIQIHFTDMPVVNTMILGVFATVAQYERELCSGRTKSALDEIQADIAKNGGHMSKAGRWIRKLGRAKGADTTEASFASGRSHSKRANDWRNSSALYLWVENQLLRHRPRKEILAEAIVLYEKNPGLYGTRQGKPLCEGTLSRWAKELRIGI